MNIITGQMPLMGFTADTQTAGQNNLVAGVPGDFMQQILQGENDGQVPVGIARIIGNEHGQAEFDLEKSHVLVTASEALNKLKLQEVIRAQDSALQSKELKQNKESASEPTVVYLLHWLATGHLSHIASDLTTSVYGQIKNTAMVEIDHSDSSGNKLQPGKNPDEISFEGSKIGFKQFDGSPTDVDVVEHERQRKAAGAAIFSEQISPYLKRRLIVSTQEDHTHIVLRDYFLDDRGNFSELRGVLANIKQNISGNITLTINGHHYGDINNYR